MITAVWRGCLSVVRESGIQNIHELRKPARARRSVRTTLAWKTVIERSRARLIMMRLLLVLVAHAQAFKLAPSLRDRVRPVHMLAEIEPAPGFSGPVLNEEERVTVSYSGSAASRERRVRRTRRPNKEERWTNSPEPEDYRRMAAFCTFDSIDLEQAITVLTNFSSFGERLSITSYTDVLHCRFFSSAKPDATIRDAFLFPYGSTVLWGFTSAQEEAFLLQLQSCCTPLSCEVPDWNLDDELGDSEFMLYETTEPEIAVGDKAGGGGASGSASAGRSGAGSGAKGEIIGSGMPVLSNNVIRLASSEADSLLEKLAVSFAFAQSAKLAVFEAALEATSEEVRPIPVQLAANGRCKLSVEEVARLTGRVFLERNAVNLYSNILDTPEFFWEAEAYEPLYRRVNRYLDIDDRVQILNKRLDIVNDLLDSLCAQLETRNAHRLELIIIYLIALEIILELAKEVTLPAMLGGVGAWPRRLLMLGWRAVFRGGGPPPVA